MKYQYFYTVNRPLVFSNALLQVKLDTLDIAGNKIRKIENVAHLSELQEFWVLYSVLIF